LVAFYSVTSYFLWWQHTPLVKTQTAAKIGAATEATLPTAVKGLTYFDR